MTIQNRKWKKKLQNFTSELFMMYTNIDVNQNIDCCWWMNTISQQRKYISIRNEIVFRDYSMIVIFVVVVAGMIDMSRSVEIYVNIYWQKKENQIKRFSLTANFNDQFSYIMIRIWKWRKMKNPSNCQCLLFKYSATDRFI